MKISSSKKQLAKIIHENGGWRDGAESAAQCSNGEISFWHDTATKSPGEDWCGSYLGSKHDIKFTGVKLPNWHQTILSRDEYFHLYPAPDAGAVSWGRVYASSEPDSLTSDRDAEPKFCTSVMRSIPEPEAKPTIEQLATDYRNAKDYADRKQQEADDAKADAEAKLAELVAAGKAHGLVLSVAEPELVITDWRDLQVDDLIWYGGDDELSPGEYHVMEIEVPDYEGYRTVLVNGVNRGHWIDTRAGWRFIRRPAKGGDNA